MQYIRAMSHSQYQSSQMTMSQMDKIILPGQRTVRIHHPLKDEEMLTMLKTYDKMKTTSGTTIPFTANTPSPYLIFPMFI